MLCQGGHLRSIAVGLGTGTGEPLRLGSVVSHGLEGEKWLLWKEVEMQTWLLSDPWAGIVAWKSVTVCPLPAALRARSPDVVSAGPSSAMLLAGCLRCSGTEQEDSTES